MAASVANALRIDPVLSFNFVIKLLDSSSSLALGSVASGIGNALSGSTISRPWLCSTSRA